MINDINFISTTSVSKSLVLSSDLAARYPIYLYLSDEKTEAIYSKSIVSLLDCEKIKKPLSISSKSLSFLLQSGVVPPPYTIYENIFIISIGDSVKLDTVNNKINCSFNRDFPFFRSPVEENVDFDLYRKTKEILELLSSATIKSMDNENPSYLFHSAGKDSNTIALALAEAGLQKKITSLTYSAKGSNDESHLVSKLAKKMGFDHIDFSVPKKITQKHYEVFFNYFKDSPLPSMDNATLLYPLIEMELKLSGANIVDGMGNDVYIGHIADQLENKRQGKAGLLSCLSPLFFGLPSESKLHALTRSRAECTGINGFSSWESKNLIDYGNNFDCGSYWRNLSKENKKLNYIDFRALIRGGIIDTEVFTRKIRNASDVYQWNLILPWTDNEVVSAIAKIPSHYLYNAAEYRNKIFLRDLLKKRLALNSDKLGKMPFEFDYSNVIKKLDKFAESEILNCLYWNKATVDSVLARLNKVSEGNGRDSLVAKKLIHRLFLISSWLNHSKYIKSSCTVRSK